jgi:23S rRNA pseudouridine1911/1915/1917 synthase
MTSSIDYLYEDEDLLVCHKMAGMATEGARAGRMDLVSAARNYLARKDKMNTKGRQRNLPPYVATVNRLDQPVEGVIVLAKTKRAASSLAQQIKEHKTEKYYYALCYGIPEEKKAHLSDLLIRRADNGLADIATDESVQTIGGEAKKAELQYEVIASKGVTALLRINLMTGRFHQIRIQLSSRGYPILGDDKYGSKESMEYAAKAGIKDVCLVAYKYIFRHPVTKKKMEFEITPKNAAIGELLHCENT